MADVAVIFDLDDTLYKEQDFVESALRALFREFGSTCPTLPAAGQKVPEVAARIIDALASATALPVADILARYRSHTPSLADTEGAADVLRCLNNRGFTTGILTDGRSDTQRNKIAALHLTSLIDPCNIFISAETGVTKPDARAWQTVADRIPATHYIYVGDNPAKDFASARALGWRTIGVADDGRNIHPQSPCTAAFAPDVWAGSLADVPSIIESFIV